MQEVVTMTQEQVRELLKKKARKIGEALLRVAVNGCDAFGQGQYRMHVTLAGPGILDLALSLADENYDQPADKSPLDEQALAFFELGMNKLGEKIKAEGIESLF